MYKTLFIILIIGMFGVAYLSEKLENERITEKERFISLYRPIKEMTIDNGINGKIEGSYILVAGSIYGTISSNRVLTIIYKEDNIYKALSIPIDNVEFQTGGNQPEISILDYHTSYENYEHIEITHIRMILPEGWKILSPN